MGFFRFRRSIKILPGIRWNIGKKSTSLSIGGKGAHYTVGSAGSRTTLGIPGTGLSYTDYHAAHHRATGGSIPMPCNEWIESQRMDCNVNLSDRKAGEGAIRPDQMTKIHKLTKSIEEQKLQSLGENQADQLIAEIESQRKEFTDHLVQVYLKEQGIRPKSKLFGGCLGKILLLIAAAWLVTQCAKNESDKNASQTNNATAPKAAPGQ